MNRKIKKSLFVLLLLCCSLLVNAQKEKLSISSNIGVTTPILDNGIGFHIGVNPSFALTSHFSIEGQVSYLHTKIKGTFYQENKE